MPKEYEISPRGLTFSEFIELVRFEDKPPKILLNGKIQEQVLNSRKIVDNIVKSGKRIYGINTGFGQLVCQAINETDLNQLQENLILSHAVGLGKKLKPEIVRGAMLLLVNSLAKGKSGIQLSTLKTILNLLNANYIPVVPSFGSLGASGDLAPLAHMALVLLGKGLVTNSAGDIINGNQALKDLNLEPIHLTAKEGLALINGTHVMTSAMLLAL